MKVIRKHDEANLKLFSKICIGTTFLIYDDINKICDTVVYMKISNDKINNCVKLADEDVINIGLLCPVMPITGTWIEDGASLK